jgi:hypothetical protein
MNLFLKVLFLNKPFKLSTQKSKNNLLFFNMTSLKISPNNLKRNFLISPKYNLFKKDKTSPLTKEKDTLSILIKANSDKKSNKAKIKI